MKEIIPLELKTFPPSKVPWSLEVLNYTRQEYQECTSLPNAERDTCRQDLRENFVITLVNALIEKMQCVDELNNGKRILFAKVYDGTNETIAEHMCNELYKLHVAQCVDTATLTITKKYLAKLDAGQAHIIAWCKLFNECFSSIMTIKLWRDGLGIQIECLLTEH